MVWSKERQFTENSKMRKIEKKNTNIQREEFQKMNLRSKVGTNIDEYKKVFGM